MRASHAPGLLALALAAGAVVSGCDNTGVEDCVSRYETLATAPTWGELRSELLRYRDRRQVVSVRTVERGDDVGVGNQKTERIVDLLDRRDRRVAQVEVWRSESGEWRAGEWLQCVDNISDP